MSIYTDSGVTLFQDTPRTVSFTATPTLVDGVSGVAGDGRRRADHRPELADADPVGRARGLRGTARHARAAIRGAARPDRRRPDQRLRRERSVGPANPALAAGSLHHAGATRPALDVGCDRARGRDRGQSDRRSVAGRRRRRCCATAASPARQSRLHSTIRPARRATPAASSSSSPRSARRRPSIASAGSRHLCRASPITPTPR